MKKEAEIPRMGAYLRLSKEDGDKTESDSIANQREFIREYAESQKDFCLFREYVDDGYSGTNFDRPAFQRMMEDIKRGELGGIIVKDLSRFGRNYIEAGRYLEKIFPFLGIRFISILDNYDSVREKNRGEEILIPFKNLMNDSYSADISMKIRSQLDVKRENGKFIGSFASYGYRKDPEDKNRLVIDPAAASVVRQIFQWKLEGYNQQKIAGMLNDRGELPPAEYKIQNGLNFDCGFQGGGEAKWIAASVRRILTNEVYTGTLVQGIFKKVNYRIRQIRPVPKKEWIRVEGTHEAIISKDVFQEVQRLLGRDTRTAPGEEAVYLFSGLLVCGSCGQSMVRRSSGSKERGKRYFYFHCSSYKSKKGCSSHLISVDRLKALVWQEVQKKAEEVVRAEQLLEETDWTFRRQAFLQAVEERMKGAEEEVARYCSLERRAHQDVAEGLLSQEEFCVIHRKYMEKLNRAKERRKLLGERRRSLLENQAGEKSWVETFRKYGTLDGLDRKGAVSLIEKIEVFHKDEIRLTWNEEEEIEELLELADLASAFFRSVERGR